MSINLTDEIEVKTKKGKLCAAKQIFLEGDTQTVENEIQDINSRHNTLNTKHESLSRTVQGIAATGGASAATNVTYNNNVSGLNAENAQDAIDELANKKFDKANIAQESGSAKDKIMSQKAVSDKFSGLLSEISEINNGITKGKSLNLEGQIVNSDGWNATTFYISIDNIKSFSVKSQLITPCLAYYDSNLKFISGISGSGLDVETFTESVLQDKPLNAKYVRFSYKHKPFKLELYTGNPNINDNLIEFVNNKIITVSNNIKIKETVSLLTKDKYLNLKGQIVNAGPNEFIATTFYISIDNIKSFSVVGQGTSLAIAYYDSNLKFISGIEGAGWGGTAFTESVLQDKPLNAKYVRFSSHVEIAPFKLELYTVSPNINDNLIEFVDNKIINKLTGIRAWENKTCAFLGDSITDKVHVGTTKNYWQFLGEILGISYVSYGINGAQSDSLINQATSAYNDNPNYDAIFILIGTNDFNANIKIGEWFTETEKETNKNGVLVNLKHRDIIINNSTFKGRLNTGLQYIKKKFPNSQVILMTPLHRAYAVFDPSNIQPDESYANTSGLFLSDYVAAIKECANIWATELIDLNAISGLYPLMEEYSGYFHNGKTDMLHPNINGHYRIAQAIAAKMNSISCLQKP